MRVEDKVYVVTGAGNGMGRELALLLLKKGAKVAGVDIRTESLNETKKLAGASADHMSVHAVNITDAEAVRSLPEQIIAIHGAIHGLINNAGIIQPFVRINDLDMEHIQKVMQVNFFGALYMTKAFLPHLLQREEAHIVNTSSMGGFLPVPGQGIYGASKAAIKLMTEALYAELRETHVHVSVVFPGAVGTHITENSGVDMPNVGKDMQKAQAKTLSPEKAAAIIVHGMEKNTVRIFVGKDSRFMDRLYRLAPGFATRFIAKQMRALLH